MAASHGRRRETMRAYIHRISESMPVVLSDREPGMPRSGMVLLRRERCGCLLVLVVRTQSVES